MFIDKYMHNNLEKANLNHDELYLYRTIIIKLKNNLSKNK